jgi:hypothetical protein
MKLPTFLPILMSQLCLSATDCAVTPRAIAGAEIVVKLSHYAHPASGRHVLILPPTGGANALDRSWARNLCAAGFNAYILEHWTGDDEFALDFGIHQRFYARTQKAIGLVLSELNSPEFVGLLGTSIGGIHAGMAMGLYPQIDAAFVIAAGADMPSMIANSDQEIMVRAWEERKKLFNLPDKAAYIKALDEHIQYDALKLPRNFEGKSLGMMIAKNDSTVPYENQAKLRELWRPGTLVNYSLNHFWAIVWSWFWDRDTVVDFFTKSASPHATE